MAYKRKKSTVSKRKPYARRWRKRYYKRKLMPRMQNYFKWVRVAPTRYYAIPAAGFYVSDGFNVKLSDIADYTAYTGIFDQYRINGITIKFRLNSPPEAATTANSSYFPDLYVTIDHDDTTPPSTPETLMQYSKMKQGVMKPDRWFTYKCHPTVNAQAYNSGNSVGYIVPQKPQWMDTAFPDVPHYAIKFLAITPGSVTSATIIPFEVQILYDITFKNAR